MGRRDRERIARIEAGLEAPIAKPRHDAIAAVKAALAELPGFQMTTNLYKRLAQIGLFDARQQKGRKR